MEILNNFLNRKGGGVSLNGTNTKCRNNNHYNSNVSYCYIRLSISVCFVFKSIYYHSNDIFPFTKCRNLSNNLVCLTSIFYSYAIIIIIIIIIVIRYE